VNDVDDICITEEGNSIVISNKTIYFIDVNGDIKWAYKDANYQFQSVDASKYVVVSAGEIDEGKWHILIFDYAGKMLNKISEFPNDTEGVYSIHTQGDYIVAGGFEYCLLFDVSGKIKVSHPTYGISMGKIHKDKIVILDEGGFLYLVDSNGKELWAFDTAFDRTIACDKVPDISRLRICGDYIFYGCGVADMQGNSLFVEEIERNCWGMDASIYISYNHIVSSLDNSVYFFDINKNLKWSKDTGAYIDFVEIQKDLIIALSSGGTLCFFDFNGNLIFNKKFEDEIKRAKCQENYVLVQYSDKIQLFQIKNGHK